MRLGGDDDRSNVEDRRGLITGGRLGIGGILLLGVLSIVFRQNFFALVGDKGAATQAQGPQAEQRREDEASLEKVAVGSFNDTQRFWGQNRCVSLKEPTATFSSEASSSRRCSACGP